MQLILSCHCKPLWLASNIQPLWHGKAPPPQLPAAMCLDLLHVILVEQCLERGIAQIRSVCPKKEELTDFDPLPGSKREKAGEGSSSATVTSVFLMSQPSHV